MKIKIDRSKTVAAALLLGLVSWAQAGGGAKPHFRSPGKPRGPVNVTITTDVESPAAGTAIPLVVEASPMIDTETFRLRVHLPEGVQLLTGSGELGPEHVLSGEKRRLEFEVIALEPGSYVIPVYATVRVGRFDQVAIAAVRVTTTGAMVDTGEPMPGEKLSGERGYEARYKTVVGTIGQ